MIELINAFIATVARYKWAIICLWRVMRKNKASFADAPLWFVKESIESGLDARYDIDDDHAWHLREFVIQAKEEVLRRYLAEQAAAAHASMVQP